MALGLHFLDDIVNVHWGGLHFLYSGADGMFGSSDGNTWTRLVDRPEGVDVIDGKTPPGAVPATGLAWVDGVWLAIGKGGPWRSTDGAKTWEKAGAPEFEQIAACKPKGDATDDEGQPIKNGIFAGYKSDEDGDNGEVYISKDLGKTFSKALTIPTTIGEDGSESAQVLSGCGNGIFLSTIKRDEIFSSGDGCVYVAMDGGGFGGRQEIWIGTTRHFEDPPAIRAHTIAYSAGAVGFDSKTKRFCLMGLKEEGFGPGGAGGSLIENSIINATGLGGSFGGENEVIKVTAAPLATTYTSLSGGLSAAGGDGKFATTYRKDSHKPDLSISGELVVSFTDAAAATLMSLPTIFGTPGSQAGPVCWKPGSENESDEPAAGTFACAAFGVGAGGGGVWIQAGGGWSKTHAGSGFTDDPQGLRGALAVGKLSWLGSDNGD